MTPELIARWAREERELREKIARQDVEWEAEKKAEEALKQRLSTSHGRFGWRIEKWKAATGSALPHHFWWLVHNCVAHPMIGVMPVRHTFAFHDYTSKKINRE
jgi:hypothetical protein